MMAVAAAQLAAMQQAATQIDSANSTFKSVRTVVAGLMAESVGFYRGNAADTLRTVAEQWDQQFSKIIGQLDQFRLTLNGNTRNYEASIQSNATSANAVLSMLNGV